MNNKRLLSIIVGLASGLLFLVACNSTPSTPTLTITIKGGACTFEGPKSISYGKFNVNWSAEDDGHSPYGYAFITLAEGKSLQDLKAYSSTQDSIEPPSWVTVIGTAQEVPGSYQDHYDLGEIALYQGQPIYFMCFQSNPAAGIGSIGPIEVSK